MYLLYLKYNPSLFPIYSTVPNLFPSPKRESQKQKNIYWNNTPLVYDSKVPASRNFTKKKIEKIKTVQIFTSIFSPNRMYSLSPKPISAIFIPQIGLA